MRTLIFFYLIAFFFFKVIHATAQPADNEPLFSEQSVLNLKLAGNMSELLKDRGTSVSYHPMTLTYNQGGALVTIPVKAKTRGHFRRLRANCDYPPLLLNFSKEGMPANSLFRKQDKLKLVTPCRGDKYIVREYLAYQMYNIITPKSLRARLVKVVYIDSANAKNSEPLFGILLEDDDHMAKRNESIIVEKKLRPDQTRVDDFLIMAVFEYLIANTDWSIQYLQNVKLIAADSMSIASPVAYDFDHSGLVGAPYAKPAEELDMSSVRQRRYRGYCMPDMDQFSKVFAQFNRLRTEVYSVFDNPLLSPGYIKQTKKFLDQFYDTINDPKKARLVFGYPCDPNGTGNVVIKGLDKD